MNKKLEIERRKLEIIKVQASKSEMQFKIMEREEDIKRILSNIDIQDKRVLELEKEISEIESLKE